MHPEKSNTRVHVCKTGAGSSNQ